MRECEQCACPLAIETECLGATDRDKDLSNEAYIPAEVVEIGFDSVAEAPVGDVDDWHRAAPREDAKDLIALGACQIESGRIMAGTVENEDVPSCARVGVGPRNLKVDHRVVAVRISIGAKLKTDRFGDPRVIWPAR